MKLKLTILFAFIQLTFSFSQTSLIKTKNNTKSSSNCENNQVDITIALTDNEYKILIPEEIDLIIPKYGRIKLNICAKDYRNTTLPMDSLELDIGASFINTTLDPIKIPPPPTASRNHYSRSQNPDCFVNQMINIDAYNYSSGIPISTGNYNINLSLKNNNIIQDKTSLPFKVSDTDYINYIENIYRNPNFDNIIVGCGFFNVLNERGGNNSNHKIRLYYSTDANLSANDVEIGTEISNSLGRVHFETSTELYNNLLMNNRYLISVIDPDNEYQETCENNNTYAFKIEQTLDQLPKILPEIEITDIRMYKTIDNKVAVSSTITNTGDITKKVSKLDFYIENYPRQFMSREVIPSLKPGQSYTSTLLVTWQYYSLRLHGKDLTVIADADNDVEEIDETNNEKRFRAPYLSGTEQTYVTVSPNPFSSYVTFDYTIKYKNTDIKLSIYDQTGAVKYQTSRFHSEPGNYRIKVYSSKIGTTGTYHYSFLKGWSGLYVPFTGTIIRQ